MLKLPLLHTTKKPPRHAALASQLSLVKSCGSRLLTFGFAITATIRFGNHPADTWKINMNQKTVFTLGAWSVVRSEGFTRASSGPNWSVYFDGKFYCSCTTKKRCIAVIKESANIIL